MDRPLPLVDINEGNPYGGSEMMYRVRVDEVLESDELSESEENEDEEDDEDEEDEDDEDEGLENSSDSSHSEEDSWITWFCSLPRNEFFCEVDESFISDDFNLTNLSSVIPRYDNALDMILGYRPHRMTRDQHEVVVTAAQVLYGLIHARYIITSSGMKKMLYKYREADFGRCPRSLCQGQPVLPNGLSDVTCEYSVEVFCPRCHESYHPRSRRYKDVDGAYFGTTFCHLFLLNNSEFIVPKPVERYVPRVFGFRINEGSHYYTLREPPQSRKKNKKNGNSGNSKNSSGLLTNNK